MITDKKEKLADLQTVFTRTYTVFDKTDEKLNWAREELGKVKKLRSKLIAQGDGECCLKEEVVRLRYENQNLKEDIIDRTEHLF